MRVPNRLDMGSVEAQFGPFCSDALHDLISGKAEFFHQAAVGSGGSEVVKSHSDPPGSDIFPRTQRASGLCEKAQGGRPQDSVSIIRGLPVE